MKKIVKGLLVTAIITPMALNAFGMGLSVPILTNVKHENTSSSDYRSGSTWKEDKVSGFGLVLDSNIEKNKLYNYRLNVESTEVETKYGAEFDRISFVNTFGFALFRNERVRVWAGPRLNIGLEERGVDGAGVEVSISPAVGVNVHLGSTVSLGLDFDYKISSFSHASGDYSDYSNEYDEELSGMMARFYVLFKFGERYAYRDNLR